MRSPHLTRRRFLTGTAGTALLLAACGRSDPATSPADTSPADTSVPDAAPVEAANDGVAAPVGDTFVDLVGPEVAPSANIGTNLLPDVVLDDLTNDRKVNFRNLVPQDRPVLLWMYAPH